MPRWWCHRSAKRAPGGGCVSIANEARPVLERSPSGCRTNDRPPCSPTRLRSAQGSSRWDRPPLVQPPAPRAECVVRLPSYSRQIVVAPTRSHPTPNQSCLHIHAIASRSFVNRWQPPFGPNLLGLHELLRNAAPNRSAQESPKNSSNSTSSANVEMGNTQHP